MAEYKRRLRLKGYRDLIFQESPKENPTLGVAYHPSIGNFSYKSAWYDSRNDEWVVLLESYLQTGA